jgi:hypothetical protein
LLLDLVKPNRICLGAVGAKPRRDALQIVWKSPLIWFVHRRLIRTTSPVPDCRSQLFHADGVSAHNRAEVRVLA